MITPYSQQQQELRRTFQHRFGAEILNWVEINTVDGFQVDSQCVGFRREKRGAETVRETVAETETEIQG